MEGVVNKALEKVQLKTSFDPILGPVISRNIALGDRKAVAQQTLDEIDEPRG